MFQIRHSVWVADDDAQALFREAFDKQERDPAEARQLYERAAALGSVHAMVNLGVMLKESEPDESRRYYRLAADRGNPRAMYNLAIATAKTDPDGALRLLLKAKQAGEPNATTKAIRHLKNQKRRARIARLQERISARLLKAAAPDGREFRVHVIRNPREFSWPWEDAPPHRKTWRVMVVDAKAGSESKTFHPDWTYAGEFELQRKAVAQARSIADDIIANGWPPSGGRS